MTESSLLLCVCGGVAHVHTWTLSQHVFDGFNRHVSVTGDAHEAETNGDRPASF